MHGKKKRRISFLVLFVSGNVVARSAGGRLVQWIQFLDSPPIQLLTRLDGLSPGSRLLLLLDRLQGAGRGILLHGRQRVDGVEEWGDF